MILDVEYAETGPAKAAGGCQSPVHTTARRPNNESNCERCWCSPRTAQEKTWLETMVVWSGHQSTRASTTAAALHMALASVDT